MSRLSEDLDDLWTFLWVVWFIASMIVFLRWLFTVAIPWFCNVIAEIVTGISGGIVWAVRGGAKGIGACVRRARVAREARRHRIREARLRLEEKVMLAGGAVDGPDRELSLKALELLRGYARQGSSVAALFIARAFRLGIAVPMDAGLARQWYGESARLRKAECAYV